MVRLAHYMGIVHPGGAFEVSTTSIQGLLLYWNTTIYSLFIGPGDEAMVKKTEQELENVGNKDGEQPDHYVHKLVNDNLPYF